MKGITATWTRDTPWRQGDILTAEATLSLGLSHSESPDSTCVVVISHDCDLANDALQIEPDVEVIVGNRIQRGDGNYFWAKAPRTLHIDALHNGAATVIEIHARHCIFAVWKIIICATFMARDSLQSGCIP
jgi:hypothetical protein